MHANRQIEVKSKKIVSQKNYKKEEEEKNTYFFANKKYIYKKYRSAAGTFIIRHICHNKLENPRTKIVGGKDYDMSQAQRRGKSLRKQ